MFWNSNSAELQKIRAGPAEPVNEFLSNDLKIKLLAKYDCLVENKGDQGRE